MFLSINNKTNNTTSAKKNLQGILVGKKLFETPADSKPELHPGCPELTRNGRHNFPH